MTSQKIKEKLQGELLDFDWQIRYVLGSNTSRNIEESLTQVSFLVRGRTVYTDSTTRNITVEFTKKELKEFISVLQHSIGN